MQVMPKSTSSNVRLCDKPLIVHKRTKSGDKDVDVSGAVLGTEAVFSQEAGTVTLIVRLAADSGSFLNPDYLIGYLSEKEGILAKEGYCEIVRTHLFLASGEDFA